MFHENQLLYKVNTPSDAYRNAKFYTIFGTSFVYIGFSLLFCITFSRVEKLIKIYKLCSYTIVDKAIFKVV